MLPACLPALLEKELLAQARPTMSCIALEHWPDPRRACAARVGLSVGLGGLCWHNFKHNRTPEHKGIMEHNRKKHMTIILFIKILTQTNSIVTSCCIELFQYS